MVLLLLLFIFWADGFGGELGAVAPLIEGLDAGCGMADDCALGDCIMTMVVFGLIVLQLYEYVCSELCVCFWVVSVILFYGFHFIVHNIVF